jgi:hypothetical protein
MVDVVAAGRIGGNARAAKLTSKRRSAIARKAAAARWGKRSEATGGAISGVSTEAGGSPPKARLRKSPEGP